MTAEELWDLSGIPGEYDAWTFGDDADGLAELVRSGKKRATSSAYPVYEAEDEALPKPGEYSIILNEKDEAVCIIQTRFVTVLPYREITEEMAAKEGEGDLSLAYWQQVHQPFFTEELKAIGKDFSEDMKVVFEEFALVFPKCGEAPAKQRKSGALYIVRHGRTDWNDQKRLQGQTDIPLNDTGRAMAKEAGERYADIPFDICFSSPLCRAKETAELLLQGRDVPIRFDDRLKEMAFGEYEGVAQSFSIPNCPVNEFFFHPAEYTEAVPGGENVNELLGRTGSFYKEEVVPLLREGKNVLIVGHGAMNLSFICNVWELPTEDFWRTGIENCKLLRLL